jgi:hypothetical protein
MEVVGVLMKKEASNLSTYTDGWTRYRVKYLAADPMEKILLY